ncbi:DNA-binding MarR family transcriptional regulator [Variovorax boronicumulans]|uniref:DNA-binding MarR family transcriptional regulator n=1 Tax=Variovorax boronicumulans TaxID=436515 RepID=A0AAW8CUJ0_9BURK|nr:MULTISPECIES: MarR family transcriptional regulator [Variovorax]MDP9891526.1 DNA-binding MarR family transcriptional regulator [Variovorax boronicumulans]MDP9992287.1 DNA-binding MarR family transcriptional regulator [Variovorax boronicumulans]MDQ0002182.1 DNA-binding MarR family transcriptional regulator [Variovorax boronicumulans]MDQ0035079.1 DNA-binding MarR family transcriptional regulator [Variovorax boronicumulans]MDQ0051594.1 DNA-binding MarR family transcriptional regulator [Variovo
MPSKRPAVPPAEAPATNPLALDEQLCFAVYSTMLSLNKVYRGLLRDLDLTYLQYLVMLVLWEKDSVNVSEICKRLALETTTLTPLLKRLEARGLIQRVRSASDERQVIVSLTTEGRAMHKKARALPACVAEAMALEPQDIGNLRDQLLALRSNLDRNA